LLVDYEAQLNLGPGAYTLTAAVHTDASHLINTYDWWDKVIGFEVVPGPEPHFIGSAWLPVRLRVDRRGKVVASQRTGDPRP
jgi:hypothetical protein